MSIALAGHGTAIWEGPVAPSVGVDTQNRSLVGGSPELYRLVEWVAELTADRSFTASYQKDSVAERFARLAASWRSDTACTSSVHEMAMHPSYQEIIGLGEKAIPLLLRELAREPDHWFWALRAITHVDPVPPADRGNLRAMGDAWVRWGRSQGHGLP